MECKDTVFEVQHVTKLYGLNKPEASHMMSKWKHEKRSAEETGVSVALWDINMKIPRGQIFVIIGLSGSGKSTLVRCFNQLNKPTYGHILLKERILQTFRKKNSLHSAGKKSPWSSSPSAL